MASILCHQPAWLLTQVIDCRRILKWTYAEGYYKFAPEEGNQKSQTAEQHERFFVFNQVCGRRRLPAPLVGAGGRRF